MAALPPMLCSDAGGTLDRVPATWVMEPKLDGWRWQVHVTETGVITYGGRNGHAHTGATHEIDRVLSCLPPGTILDGELLVMGGTSTDVPTRLTTDGRDLMFVMFDVLAVGGHDSCGMPWSHRRKLLEAAYEHVLPEDQHLVAITEVAPVDHDTFNEWVEQGVEGAVCKDPGSPYLPGKRTKRWLKVKPVKTIDLRIVGLPLDGRGKFEGLVGAVEFEIEPGKVGRASGMTDRVRQEMSEHPGRYLGRLAEFAYQQVTTGGHLRHPRFIRLRPDLEAA